MYSSLYISSHQDRESRSKFNCGFGGMDFCAIWIKVKVADQGGEIISLQVPDLDTAIICYTCEDRRSLGTPADIVNLLFKLVLVLLSVGVILLWLTFVSADEFLGVRASPSFPDAYGPIVRAGKENRVFIVVPERITTHLVNRSSMTMVHFHILLRVRGLALQNSAIFSSGEVINTLAIIREIDGQTSSVDEAHSTSLLLNISSSVYIVVVRVSFTLQLIKFSQF